jgi:hypothetical protein
VTFCPRCFVKMQNLNCDFLSCDFLSYIHSRIICYYCREVRHFFKFIYTMTNSVILSYIWRQLQWQCTRTLLLIVNYLKGDMLK